MLVAAVVLWSFGTLVRAQSGASTEQTGAESTGLLSRVWLSGQVNLITQGHASFRSPYSADNSFDAKREIRTSRVLTLYTGIRLSDRTDFLFDVEATSGNALSTGHGL